MEIAFCDALYISTATQSQNCALFCYGCFHSRLPKTHYMRLIQENDSIISLVKLFEGIDFESIKLDVNGRRC